MKSKYDRYTSESPFNKLEYCPNCNNFHCPICDTRVKTRKNKTIGFMENHIWHSHRKFKGFTNEDLVRLLWGASIFESTDCECQK